MAVEVGWAADGLAGVVDDEVEAAAGGVEVVAQGLDARGVAQVEAVDLEAVAPLVEVGLAGVADRRVAGEPGGDDELGAGPQQLDAGLVADLDPPAGEQGDPAGEVGGLGALALVERGARRAQLVVEVVDLQVVDLADVAVALAHVGADRAASGLGGAVAQPGGDHALGREDVGRGEDRLGPQGADAGLGQHLLLALELVGPGLPALGLGPLAAVVDVGAEHVAGCCQEAGPLLLGEAVEGRAVADHRLEQFGGGAQPVGQVLVGHGAHC